MRKHSLFILYFLFTQITAFAQNSIILSSDNSLSSSLVTKVFQDDKGFVWISTLNGLNKYDGTRTVQYNKKPGDPNSLRSNYINVINQDKNGYLIIGMIDGLQRYDYARDRFDSIPMLLENGDEFPAYIASILNSSDGKTYIGTSGHGIFIVEDDYTSARQKESIVPSYFIKIGRAHV